MCVPFWPFLIKIKLFCAVTFIFFNRLPSGPVTLRVNLFRDRTPVGGRYHTPTGCDKENYKLVESLGFRVGAHVT